MIGPYLQIDSSINWSEAFCLSLNWINAKRQILYTNTSNFLPSIFVCSG